MTIQPDYMSTVARCRSTTSVWRKRCTDLSLRQWSLHRNPRHKALRPNLRRAFDERLALVAELGAAAERAVVAMVEGELEQALHSALRKHPTTRFCASTSGTPSQCGTVTYVPVTSL